MADLLFGVETEYAINGMRGNKELDRAKLISQLMELAHRSLSHLPDRSSAGMFLENAARLYLDCGLHQEYAGPECSNPWDIVRYIEAGHQTLLNLAQSVAAASPPHTEVGCYRSNVDYSGSGATWGCHESFLHKMSANDLPEQIIPHLVTRIIFTGSGGFDSLSPGLRFTLSPRVSHLQRVVSSESTYSRGIYHTKNEPLCKGSSRLHVLSGESLCSHLAMFLKTGTTSLIVAMAEAGLQPGMPVQLTSPLDAIRAVASDVTCAKPLRMRGGGARTAIEIQRHYLEMAEAHAGDAFMPPWAPQVCAHWRAVIDRLENAPRSITTVLDWGIKLALYADRAARRGIAWDMLPFWTDILVRLHGAFQNTEYRDQPLSIDLACGPRSPFPKLAAELSARLQTKALDWSALKRVLELRSEFFEIDTRFGQLGSKGIFNMLDAAGTLDHRIDGVDNIEHAMANPPLGTRAAVRGEVIRRLAREKRDWHCDWPFITSGSLGKTLDLSDPFAKEERWNQAPRRAPEEGGPDLRAETSRLQRMLASFLEGQ